jgi:hypothetical protein
VALRPRVSPGVPLSRKVPYGAGLYRCCQGCAESAEPAYQSQNVPGHPTQFGSRAAALRPLGFGPFRLCLGHLAPPMFTIRRGGQERPIGVQGHAGRGVAELVLDDGDRDARPEVEHRASDAGRCAAGAPGPASSPSGCCSGATGSHSPGSSQPGTGEPAAGRANRHAVPRTAAEPVTLLGRWRC